MAKKLYYVNGIIEIEGAKIKIEEHAMEEDRYIRAYSMKQAIFLFARRFEQIFKRGVYIGDINIIEQEEK